MCAWMCLLIHLNKEWLNGCLSFPPAENNDVQICRRSTQRLVHVLADNQHANAGMVSKLAAGQSKENHYLTFFFFLQTKSVFQSIFEQECRMQARFG